MYECTSCQTWKGADEFYLCNGHRKRVCKACENAARRHPERRSRKKRIATREEVIEARNFDRAARRYMDSIGCNPPRIYSSPSGRMVEPPKALAAIGPEFEDD